MDQRPRGDIKVLKEKMTTFTTAPQPQSPTRYFLLKTYIEISQSFQNNQVTYPLQNIHFKAIKHLRYLKTIKLITNFKTYKISEIENQLNIQEDIERYLNVSDIQIFNI